MELSCLDEVLLLETEAELMEEAMSSDFDFLDPIMEDAIAIAEGGENLYV
jgi:hypothetical protein